MKRYHDVVRVTRDTYRQVTGQEPENTEREPVIGEISIDLFESLSEIPERLVARILKDANRQRIQDEKNVVRADWVSGGNRRLKARKDELLRLLATTSGAEQAAVIEELLQVNAQIG